MTGADAPRAREAPAPVPVAADAALGTCARHAVDASDECDRCGRFYCDACAGTAPNDRYCAECDAKLGVIPWEREPQRGWPRRWWRTTATMYRGPTEALRRLPAEGPIAGGYVAVAFTLYSALAGAAVSLATWWQISASLERFGARDSIGRIVTMSLFGERLPMIPIGAAAAILVTPVLLVGLGRVVGARLAFRHAMRASAYAAGLLPFAAVPIFGLLAFVAAAHSLAALTTDASGHRRLVAVGVLAGWIAAGSVAGALWAATLGPTARDLVVDAYLAL